MVTWPLLATTEVIMGALGIVEGEATLEAEV